MKIKPKNTKVNFLDLCFCCFIYIYRQYNSSKTHEIWTKCEKLGYYVVVKKFQHIINL